MTSSNGGLALAAVLLPLVFSAPAFPQERPEQYAAALQQSCSKDIKSLCRNVAKGRGRLLACLYARDTKLSPKCGAVVSGSIERLGEALGALANVRRVCEADAARLCKGVVPGDGNLVDCLARARSMVSERCNATLDLAFLRP
ncbi:MAG TPA: cysteine rich repeat-containing protein [Xanthobacteraceae bacterium]|nr:cysteine rich repeat-containing protein [Xanthobacteraceae bacterium]